MTSHKLTQLFLALTALVLMSMSALAGDPGVADTKNISDQRAGSILIYNLYSSSSTNPAAENTRIAITNTSDAGSVLVHLFFVDGRTCSVADSYLCLTKSQTATILASDVDPDVTGYLIAVATDKEGYPRPGFNTLIGDEYVKLASGHTANLGAEAISAFGYGIDNDAMSATLKFKAPRVLAIDNIPSAKDGNDTQVIVNKMIGNLITGGASADDSALFGLLFDELENSYSYSFSFRCQFRASLNDTFPRTAPRFTSVVPAGTSGWTKFWTTNDKGILGAAINKNTMNAAASFNGGHNLHKLTYTVKDVEIIVPVFRAMSCGSSYSN